MTLGLNLPCPERIEVRQTIRIRTDLGASPHWQLRRVWTKPSAQRYLITTDAQVASGIKMGVTIELEGRQAERTSTTQVFSPDSNR